MAAQFQPFHADKVQAAISSDAAALAAHVASWRRSANLHHLDPAQRKAPLRLTQGEFNEARRRMEPMLRAAQASLDRLYLAVGGVGCCVMLADRDGVPLDRRGATGDDRQFNEWGLWTGNVWSEDVEGTNGIGTCIVEQRVLTIHRDQHFLARNTLLSCTTAPIFDHEGNLAGALDVSSCRSDLTEGFVNLIAVAVGDAARRIEADHFRMAFPNARIMLAPDRGSDALIAVDADDLIIGATRQARLALGLTAASFDRPAPMTDVFGSEANRGEALAEAERSALQRALARTDGNVSAAAEALGISRATLHRKLKRLDVKKAH